MHGDVCRHPTWLAASLASVLVMPLHAGCGDDDSGGDTAVAADAGPGGDTDMGKSPSTIDTPTTYTFESRFSPGVSSVAYSGQTKRHLLIESVKKYLGELTDTTFANPSPGDVVGALRFFHEFDTTADPDRPIELDTGALPPAQTTWGDLGSLANLTGKFPENDAGFQGGVFGYGDGQLAPEQALFDMFGKVEQLVLDRFNGSIPLDPSGAAIPSVYVDADGVDYQQLIQKYLLGAVPYSQAADDYMDDDLMGKGLLSDNAALSGTNDYTPLEHVWDEGFGYFGAARNYGDYTDDEVAKAGGRPAWQGAHDADGNQTIDLKSEFVFGHAQNASKRDRGSSAAAPTDFSADAFNAFIAGRTLIVNAGGNLSEAQLEQLRGYRDAALGAWERAIAATVVHYINDTLQDMNAFGTQDYDFLAHAKHWSEMKGFALSLQFNVNHSVISRADLESVLTAMGAGPVLSNADATAISDYRAALLAARATFQTAYGFDASNMGDAMGENGW